MRRFLILLAMVFQSVSPLGAFALGVGDAAPAFAARSTHGPINLRDYAGKKTVVLALYYKDFTPA